MRRTPIMTLFFVFIILMSVSVVSAQTQPIILYTIQAGETLNEIAARFDVSPDCLAQENKLVGDGELQPGLQLTISIRCPGYDGPPIEPGGSVDEGNQGGGVMGGADYTVKLGDRLAIIARNHEVSLECLVRANNIANPDLIYVGQTVHIPGDCTIYEGQGGGDGTLNSGNVVRTPTGFLQLQLQPDGSYIVHYGDMLDFIALYFNVSTSCLARSNGLSNPGTLTPGQKIFIYPGCTPWDGPPGPGQLPVYTAAQG